MSSARRAFGSLHKAAASSFLFVVTVLYIRPLRQVFCSLSRLPSASSVPWFSSASAAWPSAPSSGACRSIPCGRRSVLNAGSDLQPICLALNHPARLLTIRSFSQRTVYFLLPPIGLSRPMPTGLQNGSPASKAAKAARRVCGLRRCGPVLYIRPLRQVFCSLSRLPSASSVPWFSSASAASPSKPSSGLVAHFRAAARCIKRRV